jgi:GT2 family glycosyltransferase
MMPSDHTDNSSFDYERHKSPSDQPLERQLESLKIALAERDVKIKSLENNLLSRDEQIADLYNSTSWRMTKALRFIGQKTKWVKGLVESTLFIIRRNSKDEKLLKKIKEQYRREGLSVCVRRSWNVITSPVPNITPSPGSGDFDRNDYTEWLRRYDTINEDKREAIRKRIEEFLYKPQISVIMPTYNPRLDWLTEAINSVRKQFYSNWELCIIDDASTDMAIWPFLQRLTKEDPRIKVALRDMNGHISVASNGVHEIVNGEWVALLDHDDILAEHALFWVADAINYNPDARLIYSDEDTIDEVGRRSNPYFKCDWNLDLFYSHNLISHLGVYQTEILRDIGVFREGVQGVQVYDLALRFIERINSDQIHHIPRVLYSRRLHEKSTAQPPDAIPCAMLAGEKALNDHFERTNMKARAEFVGRGYRIRYTLPPHPPLVTIIIPTRNGHLLLKNAITSIYQKTIYTNYEILIIDNGSDDPATLDYLDKIRREQWVRVTHDERPFNFSALNNDAARAANGEILALLNNDIEVISPDWLSEMVSIALLPQVGAVGAKLWYPNETLQHGGVILGIYGKAGHAHKHMPRDQNGYFDRAVLAQSFSAVTGACLIIQKSKFEKVGGLNETELKIALNDIDFCLRLQEAGYRNVWTPYAELYHHESVTRGYEDTEEKRARFMRESQYLQRCWREVLQNDKAYNPNLTLDFEDFSLAWPPRVQQF